MIILKDYISITRLTSIAFYSPYTKQPSEQLYVHFVVRRIMTNSQIYTNINLQSREQSSRAFKIQLYQISTSAHF